MVKKALVFVAGVAVLTLVFIFQDWYRFAKYSEIDPKRGIFGNDHLEVWIDINARMPAPMRKWACKTLLEREAAVIGGTGRAPYGCDPDFDPNAVGPAMSEALIGSMVTNSVRVAQSRNATAEQLEAIKACMQTEFVAKLPPELIEKVDGATYDPVAADALSNAGFAATDACLAKQGVD
ncbi:MAG: hypothetical protein HC844_09335 [Tabrizicola sp.]|nr:hypothetical protein [Tabrizicola sp.]